VIHQLTQAGRSLIGFLLSCQADVWRPLIAPALDGLRSCVGLLRRFSGRYVCGQRSCDMMEEFCRLTQIPLDNETISQELITSSTRPPWIRPARKKNPSGPRSTGSVDLQPPEGRFLESSRAGAINLEHPKSDPDMSSIPMPPVELMALVEDGGLDVANLFPQQSVPGFMADPQTGTPYGEGPVQRAYLGSNGMAEIVGTP